MIFLYDVLFILKKLFEKCPWASSSILQGTEHLQKKRGLLKKRAL